MARLQREDPTDTSHGPHCDAFAAPREGDRARRRRPTRAPDAPRSAGARPTPTPAVRRFARTRLVPPANMASRGAAWDILPAQAGQYEAMMGRVRVGILGSGFMGRTWAATVGRTPGAELVAIAGGRRAAGLAGDFNVPAVEPDALLADPSVDLVLILTPPRSHVDYAIAAAGHGKHVLIEKPMANTAADCDRIVAAARAADVRVGVVSQHRFRKSPLAAKRLIDDGTIGDVRMIRVIGPTAGYDAPDDKWKFDPDEQSVYADWAAHACDITRWLAGGRPTLAFASARSFTPDPPPQQSIFALYQFDTGAMADIWLTYEIPQPGLGSALQFFIVGSKGMLEFDSYGTVRLGQGDGWQTVYEQPTFNPNDPLNPVRLQAYGDELADVLAAIAGHREPQMNGTEGRITIEMVEAGERSIRTGRAVHLPLDG